MVPGQDAPLKHVPAPKLSAKRDLKSNFRARARAALVAADLDSCPESATRESARGHGAQRATLQGTRRPPELCGQLPPPRPRQE